MEMIQEFAGHIDETVDQLAALSKNSTGTDKDKALVLL